MPSAIPSGVRGLRTRFLSTVYLLVHSRWLPIVRRISSETFFIAEIDSISASVMLRAAEHGGRDQPVRIANQDRALLARALEGGDQLFLGVRAGRCFWTALTFSVFWRSSSER